eukprot:364936-Chlamydomonas_euryale.AAC.4
MLPRTAVVAAHPQALVRAAAAAVTDAAAVVARTTHAGHALDVRLIGHRRSRSRCGRGCNRRRSSSSRAAAGTFAGRPTHPRLAGAGAAAHGAAWSLSRSACTVAAAEATVAATIIDLHVNILAGIVIAACAAACAVAAAGACHRRSVGAGARVLTSEPVSQDASQQLYRLSQAHLLAEDAARHLQKFGDGSWGGQDRVPNTGDADFGQPGQAGTGCPTPGMLIWAAGTGCPTPGMRILGSRDRVPNTGDEDFGQPGQGAQHRGWGFGAAGTGCPTPGMRIWSGRDSLKDGALGIRSGLGIHLDACQGRGYDERDAPRLGKIHLDLMPGIGCASPSHAPSSTLTAPHPAPYRAP